MSTQQQRMEKLTSKLAPFLANAYQLPAEVRMELIENIDDVEERNKTMFMLLFTKFLADKGEFKLEESTPEKDLNLTVPEGVNIDDPVRMYLRKMGSVSLLTREGEVEIAKRIEEGEKEVLQAVLSSPVAIREILDIGDRLKKGKIRLRDIVKDAPEESAESDDAAAAPSANESERTEQLLKLVDKIRKLDKDCERLEESLDRKKLTEVKRRELREEIKQNKSKMMEHLEAMRIAKKQIDRIVQVLKQLIERVEKAEDALRDCEQKTGASRQELKRMLKEARLNAGNEKKICRKLSLTPEQLAELDREVRAATRTIFRVQEESRLKLADLRRSYEWILTGERKADTMEVRLDEKVASIEDTRQLGIEVGDFVVFDPRIQVTPSGFIKSRHLDDKAGVAVMLGVLKALKEHNLELPSTVNFFFSHFEEVGHGASAGIPSATKELLCIDMGAPGEGQRSDEYSVSICAKDSSGPYSWTFKERLVELCQREKIPYRVDIYPYYGSDASASLRAGHDLVAGLIGPGVDASHSYERTHQESILATANLTWAYLKSEM